MAKDNERNAGSGNGTAKYSGGPYSHDNNHSPKYSVSEVIGRLKGQSASKLRKKFTWLEKVYWKENLVWSPGYFVSTIGLNEEQIIKYVKWQESQDSGQAKLVL
jgi:putative transposase